MRIIRYAGEAGTGVAVQDGTAIRPLPAGSVAELLTRSRTELQEIVLRPGEALPADAPVRVDPLGATHGLTESAKLRRDAYPVNIDAGPAKDRLRGLALARA